MRNTIIIGGRYRKRLESALEKLECDILWLPDNEALDPRLAGHTDLSVIKISDRTVILSGYYRGRTDIVNIITKRGANVIFAETNQDKQYPDDANLCASILGRKLFHKTSITDRAVLNNFHGSIININQGYSKCSICAVGEHAAITADNGAGKALWSEDINVLQIASGNIELTGYEYGFIGGASFEVNDTIIFTGRFADKLLEERITDFIHLQGKNTLFLTDKPIFDIGSAVVL